MFSLSAFQLQIAVAVAETAHWKIGVHRSHEVMLDHVGVWQNVPNLLSICQSLILVATHDMIQILGYDGLCNERCASYTSSKARR